MRAVIGLVVGILLTIVVADGTQYLVTSQAPALFGQPRDMVIPIALLLAWLIGTFVGAGVANLIGRADWPGYAIAVLMLAVVIFTLAGGVYPVWLAVSGIVGPLLAAFLAARLRRAPR